MVSIGKMPLAFRSLLPSYVFIVIFSPTLFSCGGDPPTSTVRSKIIKLATKTSGALATTTSNSSATSLHTITFTPASLKFPIRRIEFLPEIADGKGIIFDGNETLTVTPSATQEALFSSEARTVNSGTYTGLRVEFAAPSESSFISHVNAGFELFHGTAFATSGSGLISSLTASPADQPVSISTRRSEALFATPLELLENRESTIYIYMDPTHMSRAGYGGTQGSRYWEGDCTGTYDADQAIVSDGAFICAGLPRFILASEEMTPVAERYFVFTILHYINEDGSDDPVEDANNANSAIYSIFFHPTSGTFLGGVAIRYAQEGESGGGEPAEAGYGIYSFSDSGGGKYLLKCSKSGDSAASPGCTFSSFERKTHTGTFLNRNGKYGGYGASKL